MTKRLLKDYPQVSVKPEDIEGQLDFEQIFGRKVPVHIEVGSGRGTFLVNQAKHQPDIDFLGIEWASKYYRYAVDRIGRWDLKNVRIIRTDASDFLSENIGTSTVYWYHIYFPDPWNKKRHHKRRFICTINLHQMLRSLKTGGIINVATDHAGYFEQIKDLFEEEGKIETVEFTRTADTRQGEVTGTNYERKYIKAGKPIYTIAAKKILK